MSKSINYSDDSVVQAYLCVLFKQISRGKAQSPEQEGVDCASAVSKAIRLLRPGSSSTASGSGRSSDTHAVAAKVRLRQLILSESHDHSEETGSTGRRSSIEDAGSGPVLAARFEKECDSLRRRNPALLNSFLLLFKPLSFHYHPHGGDRDRRPPLPPQPEMLSTNQMVVDTRHRSSANPAVAESKDSGSAYIWKEDMKNIEKRKLVWISREIEVLLLTDIVFIAQGINGKHIKYDPRAESFALDPTLALSVTVRDTVLCLCELGWLFLKVADYLKQALAPSGSAGGPQLGLVAQAFGFALQDELNDYYRLLAVLEKEVLHETASQDLSGINNNNNNNNNSSKQGDNLRQRESAEKDNTSGTSGLTLLRMRAWMQEPIERMCLMARLCDSCGPLRGGALASRLHCHAIHGDIQSTAVLVHRVMDSVCSPIYTMIAKWLLQGELSDPHHEFFIGAVTNPSAVQNVWRDTYFLRPAMLPIFLPIEVATKILLIGKTSNFLKICLPKLSKLTTSSTGASGSKARLERGVALTSTPQTSSGSPTKVRSPAPSYRAIGRSKKLTTGARVKEEDTLTEDIVNPSQGSLSGENKHALLEQIESALNSLRYGGEMKLAALIYSISSTTDAKLLGLLKTRFHLETHLQALKKFMLLGQGDFVTCLMDGVGPELRKRASQLYRHNLTGILEGALRSSNAQFQPSYVLDRIGIRLLEAAPGDSGWEVFSLDYSMDSPLNAVVSAEALSKYRICFHMLWRLKRVEWSLSLAWKQIATFQRGIGVGAKGRDRETDREDVSRQLRTLRNVFHRCALSRNRMMHVVNNLSAFLMFEVMESAWAKLLDHIHKATCLDDVVIAHESYLNEILDRALLAPQHETLNMQIQQLLQIILRFCNLEDTLISDATASVARQRMARARMEESSARGGWGDASVDTAAGADDDGLYGGIPEYVIHRLDDAVVEYGKQFDSLMTLLKEQGGKADDILRFLTFRLDFNDYHAQTGGASSQLHPFRVVLPQQQQRWEDDSGNMDSSRLRERESLSFSTTVNNSSSNSNPALPPRNRKVGLPSGVGAATTTTAAAAATTTNASNNNLRSMRRL